MREPEDYEDELICLNLSEEHWREYEWYYDLPADSKLGHRVVRIDNPKNVYFRPGGITHRVTQSDGTIHIVPAPGVYGCVVRICVTPTGREVRY